MKLLCTCFFNEITKEYQDVNQWLTIGKEYIVLEIEMSVGSANEVFYRLVGDNDDLMPALYDARQFKIISGKIPSNWYVSQIGDSKTIGPKTWQELGFWEDCYDYDPAAMEIYRREARIIMEECNED